MKKLRVAVIGNGMVANAAHLPVLSALAKRGLVEIVACADIRPEAAESTARRWGIPAYYTDAETLLEREKPDFVAVCTNNVAHKAVTIAALRAGADVACEKPMALKLADAEEMFAVAAECGKHLFPCQCMRWRNYMQKSKELIENGEIGSPYYADVSFIRRIGIPTWGMHHIKEYNFGGPFCDLGVHLIDSLLWLIGSPDVISVSGTAFSKIAPKGEDILLNIAESGAYAGAFDPRPYKASEFSVEDFAAGTMRLAEGIAVNFKFSWAINLPTTNLDMVICGDEGGLSVNRETLYKNVGRFQTESAMKWFDNGAYKGRTFEQHWYMYDHIMEVLEGKAEYLITREQNLEVTKAIECFYKSAELNREVRSDELCSFGVK